MEIIEVIKQEENEPKNKPRNKTLLELEKLVQPLESKINLYNIEKDLQTTIETNHLEIKTNNSGTKETQKEKEPINSLRTTIVNTTNKVKSIMFLTTIKLKKTSIQVVPQEDQQTLTQPVELVQYYQDKLVLTKYIANVPIIINNITVTLPQTYLVPNGSLYPFILGLNFAHSLQGGITIQNNQVSFHPKTTTIVYTNTENILNTTNNIASHYTNKIEELNDNIVNDYSKKLKNALKLKKNLLTEAEKIGIIG